MGLSETASGDRAPGHEARLVGKIRDARLVSNRLARCRGRESYLRAEPRTSSVADVDRRNGARAAGISEVYFCIRPRKW